MRRISIMVIIALVLMTPLVVFGEAEPTQSGIMLTIGSEEQLVEPLLIDRTVGQEVTADFSAVPIAGTALVVNDEYEGLRNGVSIDHDIGAG